MLLVRIVRGEKAKGGRDGTMWPVGRRSSRQRNEKEEKGGRKKRGGSRKRGGTIWERSDQKGRDNRLNCSTRLY